MSSKPTRTPSKRSNPSIFSRRQTKGQSQHLTSEAIAADIAAFKKRGGRIEVLGNTPYRPHLASTTFRSNVKSKRKAATATAAKSTARA